MNPYQPPDPVLFATNKRSASLPWIKLTLWLLAYLYPLWLVGSFYVTWVVAWVSLGRIPRPSLDDPKSIGGFVDVAYVITGLLAIGLPGLVPLGLAASFYCPVRKHDDRRLTQAAALAIIYIILCAVALVILRADPLRVVYWWID